MEHLIPAMALAAMATATSPSIGGGSDRKPKRGATRLARKLHEASIAKPKSQSLQRMLKRAR